MTARHAGREAISRGQCVLLLRIYMPPLGQSGALKGGVMLLVNPLGQTG